MRKFKDLSIRKKLLISILTFSLLLVGAVTGITSMISYNSMKKQLIYNRRMSIGWLQDRISLDLKSYKNEFYKFEVEKEVKENIWHWCNEGKELDYNSKNELISFMNTIISMDSNINSIELYNLDSKKVLIAERRGAELTDTGNRLDQWEKRDNELQTSIVFQKQGKEIAISHEIYDFFDNKPIALVVMKIRPYALQDNLEGIKTTPDELILLYNDENQLIEGVLGKGMEDSRYMAKEMIVELSKTGERETFSNGCFWFYREISGGKLKILFAVPDSSIVGMLKKNLLAGGMIGILAVIISTLVSIVFSRIFSRPLIALSQKMRTVTIDEYTSESMKNRRDEIGILQDSFNVMINRNQKLITAEYKSKIQKRDAQIRALQAQINPHFMYNTLQTIGGMALKKNAPQIYNMTTSLSDIMRYSIDFSGEMVRLREEIGYLKSYLMIQNERFDNRLDLELSIPERDLLEYRIPKLILQPVIENSLKHGFSNKAGKWIIRVSAKIIEEGDLLLEICDNGVGVSGEKLKEIQDMLNMDTERALKSADHIGLQNVHYRIKLRYMDEKYGVTIKSTEGQGTTVCILTKAVKS